MTKQQKYALKNKELIKQRNAEYKELNKDLIKEKNKLYREDNKEKIKISKNKWVQNNLDYQAEYQQKNRPLLSQKQKNYYHENKELIMARQKIYRQNRKHNDVVFKIKCNIQNLINNSIKRNGYSKQSRTFEILGCTYEVFKNHMESQWLDWMNWNNYGLYNGELNYGWDIDHIIPSSSATSEAEIIRLNHYTNLQPLCSKVNRVIKRNS